jgi:hypothetical protein
MKLEVGQYITIIHLTRNKIYHCKITQMSLYIMTTTLPDGSQIQWAIDMESTDIPGCSWEPIGIDDDFQFRLFI